MNKITLLCVLIGLSMTPCSAQERLSVLNIRDARPVAQAILEIERLSGIAINYEDPKIAFSDDLEDITATVVTPEQRKMAEQSGRSPIKIIVPKARAISVSLRVDAVSGRLKSQNAVVGALRDLLASYNTGGGRSASFRLNIANGAYFVEPTDARDANGARKQVASILSLPVTLPQKSGLAAEALKELMTAISKSAGQQVGLGSIPMGLFARTQVSFGANSEAAHLVLQRLLKSVSQATSARAGGGLAYRLLYDAQSQLYLLNLHQVLPETATAPAPPANPQQPVNDSRWHDKVK